MFNRHALTYPKVLSPPNHLGGGGARTLQGGQRSPVPGSYAQSVMPGALSLFPHLQNCPSFLGCNLQSCTELHSRWHLGKCHIAKTFFWSPLQTFQHVLWIILNGGKLSSHKDSLVWGISWVVCSPAWKAWQLKRVIPSETPEEVGPLLPDPAPPTPGHQPWRATEHLGLAARNWYVLKCQIYTRFGRLKECKTARSSMIFLSYWLHAEMALFGSKWAKSFPSLLFTFKKRG